MSYPDYMTRGTRDAINNASSISKKYIENPVAVGVSGAAALGLGVWGLNDGVKEWKDAIPVAAVGLGSVGLASSAFNLLGVDRPLEDGKFIYPVLAGLLVLVLAISSQNIHKSKDMKDDHEKAEFWVNLITLCAVIFAILALAASRFRNTE